ncbi:hypothetical protein QTP88_013418 [Uroleucon formosanum]
MIIIKAFVLNGFFSLIQPHTHFMPNLPMGEYRTVFEKLYPCDSTRNYPLQFNNYFNKITSNTTELKGNITALIPFDDTLTFDMNFASWGSTGGWKPNSYIYITKKACSALKNLGGKLWLTVSEAFNFPNAHCPIPVGTYITSGIDLRKFEDHSFPKVYFYGKYKVVFKVKNKENKVLGCENLEISLIRPLTKITYNVTFFSLTQWQNRFMPNLHVGEYCTVTKRAYFCESIINHSFKFNYYLSKKTSILSQLKGNITFDDIFIVDVNFASWRVTGDWTPNSFVYITKNACS